MDPLLTVPPIAVPSLDANPNPSLTSDHLEGRAARNQKLAEILARFVVDENGDIVPAGLMELEAECAG